MYILKVITEEVGLELDILKRYDTLKRLIDQDNTSIKKIYLINKQGEILNEYKRL